MLFNRLHRETKAVLTRTYAVSQQYGENHVNPEHLLLALLDDEIVTKALLLLSVDVEAVRLRLKVTLSTGSPEQAQTRRPGEAAQVFITPRVKRILELAFAEAEPPSDSPILPEHLFLALLREPDAALAQLLTEHNLTPDRVEVIINTLRRGTE
jgi:ATP-dependent Clp protease ATP-binding subunit ClpC